MLIAIMLPPVVIGGWAGLGAATLGLFSALSLAARSSIVSLTLLHLPAIPRRRKRSLQRQTGAVQTTHEPPLVTTLE